MSWLMKLDKALLGWPDVALTWILTVLCIIGLVVAWFAPPALKAFVTAYFLLP